jgi:transposase-like protein
MQQQTFTQEFKDQIVELHRKCGRTFMDLAKEFNIAATTVSNWVRAADKREAQRARSAAAADAADPGGRRSVSTVRPAPR